VSVPELVRILGALHEDRGTAGEAIVAYRKMAEDITQPLADLVAGFGDALVGGAAMRAGVATVLDQSDWRRFGSKCVILRPHAPVEPIAVASVGARHPIASYHPAFVKGSITQKARMPRPWDAAAASQHAGGSAPLRVEVRDAL
jgi:hypothetical protein